MVMTLPNLLTLSRLLALPFIVHLFRCGHGVAAASERGGAGSRTTAT